MNAPISYRSISLSLLFAMGVGIALPAGADGGHGGGGHAGGGHAGGAHMAGGGHFAGSGQYHGFVAGGGGRYWNGGRYYGGGYWGDPWYRGDWGWGVGLGLGLGYTTWALASEPLYYNPYPWGVGYSYYAPYPATVVVTQPGPPVSPQDTTYIGPAQPAAQNWFYCDSAKGYYPYVPQCPEPWRAVPAQPPGAIQQ